MGAVYLATHLGTERYVALKLIAPQFMRNDEFVARFKREARAAGRLRHPNVVDVTDFGFARAGKEPVAYLVMEYLDGCTLGDVLEEEKRLPVEWVVDILEQVCSTVHEAHRQGIVHRDLKPENIWLEPNRLGSYRVKVLDFGIAKLAEVETENNEGQLTSGASHGEASSTTAAATAHGMGGATQIASSEAAAYIGNPREAGTVMPGARVTNVTNFGEDPDRLQHDTPAYSPQSDEKDDGDQSLLPDNDATKLFAGPAATCEAEVPDASAGAAYDEDADRTLMLDQATRRLGAGSHSISCGDRVCGAATRGRPVSRCSRYLWHDCHYRHAIVGGAIASCRTAYSLRCFETTLEAISEDSDCGHPAHNHRLCAPSHPRPGNDRALCALRAGRAAGRVGEEGSEAPRT